MHRSAAATCSADRPASVTHDGGFNPTGPYHYCQNDAQCTQGKNGRCEGVFNSAACNCDYDECSADADCATGAVCVCRSKNFASPRNYCATKGDCTTDHDCGSGYCSPSRVGDTCNGASLAYYCHQDDDECTNDTDCTAGYCVYADSQHHWQCAAFPYCDAGVAAQCQ